MATTTPTESVSDVVNTARTLAVHTASAADGLRIYAKHPEVYLGSDTDEAVTSLLDAMSEKDRLVKITVEWEHITKNGNYTTPKIVFVGS